MDRSRFNSKDIARVRTCLEDDQSKLALDKHIPNEATEMLFKKFMGCYRSAIAAIVSPLIFT